MYTLTIRYQRRPNHLPCPMSNLVWMNPVTCWDTFLEILTKNAIGSEICVFRWRLCECTATQDAIRDAPFGLHLWFQVAAHIFVSLEWLVIKFLSFNRYFTFITLLTTKQTLKVSAIRFFVKWINYIIFDFNGLSRNSLILMNKLLRWKIDFFSVVTTLALSIPAVINILRNWHLTPHTIIVWYPGAFTTPCLGRK